MKKLKFRKGDFGATQHSELKAKSASSSLIAVSDQLSDHKIYQKMGKSGNTESKRAGWGAAHTLLIVRKGNQFKHFI